MFCLKLDLIRGLIDVRLWLPDFQTFGTRRWSVCQPYVLSTFITQEIFLVLIYFRACYIMWRKILMTPSGYEPTTSL